MTTKDDLGDRMKALEGVEAKRTAPVDQPIVIRVDGKRFSQWTRGLWTPFDERMMTVRHMTAVTLLEELGAVVAFHQSDEISLVLAAPVGNSQRYCGGRYQKIVSHAASIATATWNTTVPGYIPEKIDKAACFDARAWSVPSPMEAWNALLWRQLDARNNAISMAARASFSHKELLNKSGPEMVAMLAAKGIDYAEHFPAWAREGTFVGRRLIQRTLTAAELAELPPRHHARLNPGMVVERSVATDVFAEEARRLILGEPE